MFSSCCCRLSELIIMVLFSIIISFSLDYSLKVTSLLFCLLLPQMSFMKRYWTELNFLFISVQQFLILVLTSSYTFQMLDSALFFSSLSNFSFILASCSSCTLFSSSSLAEYSKSSCCLMALSESSSQFWFCWLKLCISFFLQDSIFCCEMAFILLFFAASSERQAFWSKPKILLVYRYSRYSSASLSLSFCAQVCLMERSYCSRAYAVAISIYLLLPFQNYCLSLLRVSQISRFLSYRCLSMRSFASLSLCSLSLNQLSFSCWYLLTFSCMSYQQTLLNSLFFTYNSFQYYFSSALMDSQSCSYIFALILSFSALILSYSLTSFCLPLKSWSISASYSCFNFFIRPSQRCLSSIQKSFHSFLSRQSYSSNSYSYYCYILGSSLTAGVDYATGLEEKRLELLSLEAKRLELLFKLLEARPSWLLAFMFMDFRFFLAIFSFCCSYFLRYSRSVG